ncbi:MAG: aminopeptidase P family protein [Armatimonadetes bacterium]|nr:aminopeptidase P family protein [Armatimonadota bacterium]
MSNLQRLQARIAKEGFPTVLLSDPTNVGWATGFTGSFGYAVIGVDKAIFITDSRYAIQAREQVKGYDVHTFAAPMTGAKFLGQVMAENGVTEVGFESETVTVSTLQGWEAAVPNVKFRPLAGIVGPVRQIKTAEEQDKLRKACKIADATYEHMRKVIRAGVTEYDLLLELEFFIRRQHAPLAFDAIVVSGPNSARPHGKSTDRVLVDGDFLTMDFGADYQGYKSDITRTVVIGKATDRHKEIYNQVLKSQLASIEMMKPGVKGRDVDARCREILDEKGLAKYFGHSLGHGLGIAVHDGGALGPSSEIVLEEGQVWTVEPGVYIEGYGGVRIENDVVVTSTGVEIFDTSTKELLEF